MSGREEGWVAPLLLRSELKNHVSGQLSCPSEVTHRLDFENYQLCDIRVNFTSEPEDAMMSYASGPSWSGRVRLPGSSVPRKRRRDWREDQMRVAELPSGVTPPLRRDLEVSATVQGLHPAGPEERSAEICHPLTLG